MPEKTLNASKKFILLRLICMAMVILAVSLCVLPCSVSAAVDYNDYISNLKVDGDNDLVTVTFPGSFSNWSVSQNGSEIYNGTSESFSGLPVDGLSGLQVFSNVFYGSGRLDVTNIPDGTSISGSYNVRINWSTPTTSAFSYRKTFVVHYLSSSGYVGSVVIDDSTYDDTPPGTIGYGFTIPYSFVMDKPDSALTAYFEFQIAFLSNSNSASSLSASMSPMTMQMSISSLYRLQQQSGKTNKLLEDVKDALSDQGKTLEDVLTQQGQTNDKLDKLPGEIGDEMQGVIESEKEQSKVEGNEFVDQILDALPDPSQDVLAALAALTDSMAYTGMDAVLPIPALVLPGIDGLFPETEIWGGTEFSFADYLGFLPSKLLTLVQSLFTIAIVLFCAYEIKGIVSYCLTLHESKGG